MGEAFAALSKQRPWVFRPFNGKKKKPGVDVGNAIETNGERDDSDVQELLATSAENDSEGTKPSSTKTQDSCNNEGEDDLLKKVALDFSKDDLLSSPTSKQLADITNKSIVGAVSKETGAALRPRANARNMSTSFLSYGGITYLINSFDYPNLLYYQ